jgi:hypothetical protein
VLRNANGKKEKEGFNGFINIIFYCSDYEAVTLLFSEDHSEGDLAIDHPLPAGFISVFHFSGLLRFLMLMPGTPLLTFPDPSHVGQSFQKISKPTRQ